MPKASEARIRANSKYNRKAYETIQVRAKKDERLGELLNVGAARAGVSKAAYIVDAIKARLEEDGITSADIINKGDQTE